MYSQDSRSSRWEAVATYFFFSFLNENICCGYSLEVPLLLASKKYLCLSRKVRKILVLFRWNKCLIWSKWFLSAHAALLADLDLYCFIEKKTHLPRRRELLFFFCYETSACGPLHLFLWCVSNDFCIWSNITHIIKIYNEGLFSQWIKGTNTFLREVTLTWKYLLHF